MCASYDNWYAVLVSTLCLEAGFTLCAGWSLLTEMEPLIVRLKARVEFSSFTSLTSVGLASTNLWRKLLGTGHTETRLILKVFYLLRKFCPLVFVLFCVFVLPDLFLFRAVSLNIIKRNIIQLSQLVMKCFSLHLNEVIHKLPLVFVSHTGQVTHTSLSQYSIH